MQQNCRKTPQRSPLTQKISQYYIIPRSVSSHIHRLVINLQVARSLAFGKKITAACSPGAESAPPFFPPAPLCAFLTLAEFEIAVYTRKDDREEKKGERPTWSSCSSNDAGSSRRQSHLVRAD